MKDLLLKSLVLMAFLVVASAITRAQPPARDQGKEELLYAQLKSIAPKALPAFQAGTEAMDNGDFETCIGEFGEVLRQAPEFDPALRRAGHCLIATGEREDGFAMIQQALDANRSAENLLSMAIARLEAEPSQEPTKDTMASALSLAVEASKLEGEKDRDALLLIADLSLRLDRMEQFKKALVNLKTSFSENPYTHYFAAIDLGNSNDFDGALAELGTAESLGLDPTEATSLRGAIEEAQDAAFPLRPYIGYIYIFLAITLLWMLGLVTLYLLGRLLSSRTLAAMEMTNPDDITAGGTSTLKTAYKWVITLAGLYYYISQPMVVALIVALTGGLIFAFFMVGRIPIGFLIGLVFVGGGSIFFMCKSLIVRPKVEDPGRVLKTEEAPKLYDLARTVAEDIGTRVVDEIRVTPGVDVAVYERGSFREKTQDKGERILILGAGTFNGFSINAFRAVLAHEYGHLSNRDTAGGEIAFHVSSNMARLAEAMVASGTNTYHNLAFHFLRLYNFIFRRITHGACRLQEVLADRVAVRTYGTAAFSDGLRHVVRQEFSFNRLADMEISTALADRRKFNNFYDARFADTAIESEIDEEFRTEFERRTTDDDTHPAGVERIRLAEKIVGQTRPDVDGMVWDLFTSREAFTQTMVVMAEEQIRGDRYKNYHDIGIADAGN